MKKIIAFVILILAVNSTFAQVFLFENFNSEEFPPTGWSIDTLSAQWTKSTTANAGGTSPEIKFSYINQNTTTRLISPLIDLTESPNATLSFNYFYDWYANGVTFGVAKRIDPETWEVVWSVTPTGNQGPTTKIVDFIDVGSAEFQFCFFLSGNLYNMDYLFLDNVKLFNRKNRDVRMLTLDVPSYIRGSAPVSGKVINDGNSQINSFDINWSLDNGLEYVTSYVGLNLESDATFDYICDAPIIADPGYYSLKVWLSNVNGIPSDENPDNDSLVKFVAIPVDSVLRKPLLEVFTSSTCIMSASFNSSILGPFVELHESEFTFIRYPMNWPGTGDPYYTSECGVRRVYYDVYATPTIKIDGLMTNATQTSIGNIFQNEIDLPAFLSIEGSHQIVNDSVIIEMTLNSYVYYENVNVFAVVIERTTHNNATSNGETSFRNVFMKSIPNANGNLVNLITGEQMVLHFSETLNGTNIEDLNDLQVVLFVQDQSKNILQSAISTGYYKVEGIALPADGGSITGTGNYPEGQHVTLEAIPMQGFTFENWSKNNEVISTESLFSFVMPNENLNLTANFSLSCEPNWEPMTNLQYNMQIVAQILIDGQVSLNVNDVLGAFVGEECRGIASPQPDADGLVFLTVGSDIASGEQVELKIWKRTGCIECDAIPDFEFVNQAEIGNFLEPFQVRCGAKQDLSFGQGYTWFSLNVNPGSMSPNSLFSTLSPCYDDRLIGQTSFALYTGTNWIGSLTNLSMNKMYRMKLCRVQNLSLMGDAAPLSPINLSAGYTWLGYSPQECLPINEALAFIFPAPAYNDRLIGQNSFALYTGTQWIGTLTTLCPDAGYVIRMGNASTLNWPGGFPVAVFTVNITEGPAPLTVDFTDQSLNDPDSWLWDFGDGNTSNTQNPTHTYQNAGSYTVQLTVSNGSGNSDTETKTAYITVTENILWPPGTVHCTGTPTAIVDVTNPVTGKTWMDRNLGASQAATSSTDELAYGDLYQWGRIADGHQCRNSEITTTLSPIDIPGHSSFIVSPNSPNDWRSPQNNNLWQGVNGINNPCPSGYRLPTDIEWESEHASWSSDNSVGAFDSPLKLPLSGRRNYSYGSVDSEGLDGYYWKSTVEGTYSRFLSINGSDAYIGSDRRAYGLSNRCIKDATEPTSYNLNIEINPSGTGSATGAGTYQAGTAVNITAISNQGWEFVNWTGDVAYLDDPGLASANVTMPEGNISLTANFQEEGNLWPPGTVHCTGTPTAIVDVTNPITGKTWMDRNLGAAQAATSSTDELAYGDLYQWGRFADGHQCRNSVTTSTLSGLDAPGHGDFIVTNSDPYDWRSPQNDNLWQGNEGINNPCPSDYRLPTVTELDLELQSWISSNAAGAFNSPLKLLIAGLRASNSGFVSGVGSHGLYWSATAEGTSARYLYFGSSDAYVVHNNNRAHGLSVRCIKD